MSEPGALNILVVDDEPSIVDLLSEYLRARGHRVWTASDGERALAILDEQDLDLVLTDMKMPGMGGLELLDRVRQRERFVGAILMTGYGTIDTALRAMKTGAQDYLLKPFKLREVHAAIIRAAERTRLERETVRLRQVVRLFETSRALEEPTRLDELYAHLASVASQELRGRGALVAFKEPAVGGWVEYCRTARAPFSGLDLQALARSLTGESPPSVWISPPQPLLAAPIRAQIEDGQPSRKVGLVAVIGETSDHREQVSLEIAAALVGDALSRQVLGDPSRKEGGRWGAPLPVATTRAERLAALVERAGALLDEEERALACRAAALHGDRTHSLRGLLRGQLPIPTSGAPADARRLREILLGVHERFDGCGSPRGLGGEGIPRAARLVAIADRWDLLTASRAYAPRLDGVDARLALSAEAGASLDPALLQAFLEMV